MRKRIALGVALLGIIGILITSNLISTINQETDIYGLGDVANLSCSKIETLDEFFGIKNTDECNNDGAAEQREQNRDKLPLLGGVRIASGVGILLGMLLFFLPKLRIATRKVNPHQSPEETIEKKLQSLSILKEKGLISSEEYASRRQSILEEL